MISVKKPAEIPAVNGYDYLLDEKGELMLFNTEEEARAYLHTFGITNQEMTESGVIFQIEVKLTYIGEDDWSRALFQKEDGQILVDVDDELYDRSAAPWFEPQFPTGIPTPEIP